MDQVQLNNQSANFYVSVLVNVSGSANAPSSAPFVNNFGNALSQAAVVLAPTVANAALEKGLYVQVAGAFKLALKSIDLAAQMEAGASIAVYSDLDADFTIPTGTNVFKNGVASVETTIPAGQPNVVWAVCTPGGASGGGYVTSVNGKTGAVTLTATDVGAATTAQGAKADSALQTVPAATAAAVGGVKVAVVGTSGLTLSGDGTLVVGTGGVAGVANGGTGAATLTGYVKGNGTAAMTASATIPFTDLSGTATAAQIPAATATTIGGVSVAAVATSNITLTAGAISVATATNAVKGVASFSTGLSVAAGVVTVAAVGATAGNIGGITRQAAVTALTDNSGGTASATIAAITDVPTANAIASLNAQLNTIYTALRAAGNFV